MLSYHTIFRATGLILLFSFVCGFSSLAQRYPIKTYTQANGLANSMIFDLKQDSLGQIWIARRSGISSFDGIKFTNFNINDGLSSTSYAYLRIDSKNKLWALDESGQLIISSFSGKRWNSIYNAQGQISGNYHIYTAFEILYQDEKPVVLVGSDKDGIFRFQNNQWKQFKESEGLPGNNVNSILQFKGKVYVATNKGICIFMNNAFDNSLSKLNPCLSKNILAMVAKGNVLWLLGENWLGNLCEGKFTLTTANFRLPIERNGRRSFIQSDRAGRLYFGNLFKVFCYDIESGSVELLTRNNGLISEGGSSVLCDYEGNIWIGGSRGITKIQSRRFASYYNSDGLFSNEVASGMEISKDHYVFGHDGVLSFYDGKSFKTLLLDPSLAQGANECRVLDLAKDTKGNIWAAVTTIGLARIDANKKVKWFGADQGLEGFVFSVLATLGGKLYIGTSSGLFEMDGERFVKVYNKEMHGASVRKLFPGQKNSIFISTITWGVLELHDGKMCGYRSPDNELANNVFAFCIDSKNRKWVGTAAGLYMIRDSILVKAGDAYPAISHPVYFVLEDNNGRIWFGSDNGIYRWDEKTLDHFSTPEGIAGQEINRSAGFMDTYHRIWFGTNNGLTVYNPALDYKPYQVPPPLLTLLYIESGSDTLPVTKPVSLQYDMNNPVFHFRAISFTDEEELVYKYKLEGIDTAWSGEVFYLNNSVRYNNLNPGTYRFCVKARNSLGVWCEPVCSLTVKVERPFWFRWWFVILAVIFLGGIGILLGRYILIIRYNARLETMVSERTRELEHSEQMLKESNQAKDNFFSIIAHDLRSPFNIILGMLDLLTKEYSEYSDEERQMMLNRLKSASTRTIDLLENLLTWARSQRGMLPYAPVKFDILEIIHENFLLFESAAQSKDILIKQHGEKNLMVIADRNMINTIVRNLISNAIKFTFAGGSITIKVIRDEEGQVIVSIRDTGFGITPDAVNNLFKIEKRIVTRGTNNEMGTGLGLILSKDFIVKNNGKIWVESAEGEGSCFYFSLPVCKSLA
jgi:signal transduction histidine kinase/ligand-binding sensor domain-containing protein